MAEYEYNTYGELALAPKKLRSYERGNEIRKVEIGYEKHELEDTATYKMISKVKNSRIGAMSTVALASVAIVLVMVACFRMASIFEITKQTRLLNKANTKSESHIALDENKVAGSLSYRDAKTVAESLNMKKYDKDDVIAIDMEGMEFTEVHYQE